MELSNLSPKRRKVELLDDSKSSFFNDCKLEENIKDEVCVTTANSTTNHNDLSINSILLSRFLERLKLRTVPLILPLLDRLAEAENKNINALKSIDKINKRIKELEVHVEKKIKTGCTTSTATGTDITDQHSEEYKRIMNALQSSPFAPFKPNTSQACRQIDRNDSSCSNFPMQQTVPHKVGYPPKSENTNEFTKVNGVNQQQVSHNNYYQSPTKTSNSKLDLLSAKFLPASPITNLLGTPDLNWSLVRDGICLQWDLQILDHNLSPIRYEISSFQKSEITATNFPWRKIGEVVALPLPMACTLTYVAKMNTYFFAIRAWLDEEVASRWSNVIMVDIN